MEIYGEIADIVGTVFRMEPESLRKMSGDAPLGTIGLDSLNCMEIVVHLEERFDIVFHDEDLLLDRLNTMNKLNEIVRRKLEHYQT
ncbi:acyl carrier protein [Cohnella cholangitidis]|uniref:Acyl carrier protein n=1 Tax=Cohnella cholangitidis TaxID=2598458 RepID=A0A7G5BVJ7_9BACL|nr:acyl carrier protein [Cohnella cholangitidis]QMV40981.1 acyl carrier protein [Cohnella cholangitidis]